MRSHAFQQLIAEPHLWRALHLTSNSHVIAQLAAADPVRSPLVIQRHLGPFSSAFSLATDLCHSFILQQSLLLTTMYTALLNGRTFILQDPSGWKDAFVRGRALRLLKAATWRRLHPDAGCHAPAPREGGAIARFGGATLIIGGWTVRAFPRARPLSAPHPAAPAPQQADCACWAPGRAPAGPAGA